MKGDDSMAQATAEVILAEIAALPPEEREKLWKLLNRRSDAAQNESEDGVFIPPFDAGDPGPSLRWIEEHSKQFASQYAAVDGDRLVPHGTYPLSLTGAVHSSVLYGLFFTLIQPIDAPPFAGF